MRLALGALAIAALAMLPARDAHACGGFFCSQSPVDQSAEHILFVINPTGTTTMVVQIAYAGGDDDFSWVLPLGAVPDAGSLEVFPQLALTSLAANTGPIFNMPPECWNYFEGDATAGGGGLAPPSAEDGDVTVHLREEVGPYDVAVVESTDSAALVDWLRTNGYRITAPMEPYISTYTSEGMKFLALKLLPAADTSQIQPLKLTLPGQAPVVPVRLTAIAAEPEMGILVSILGDQRFEPANWPSLNIRDDEIAFDQYNTWGGNGTNWTSLVARKVDEAGGQGFVTEYAGPTQPFFDMVQNSPVNDDVQEEARDALLSVMEGRPYLTRLYTRLSPEEMSTDPLFRRSEGGDVAREHQLSRIVDGVDMCPNEYPAPVDACEFATCGAGGLCRTDDNGVAGCACLAEATARPTMASNGTTSVVCQDARMSFVNPGDVDDINGGFIADPCLGTSCGANGRCVAVNLTTTCACDEGFIAVADGAGGATCVTPSEPVPESFYDRTMREPARPGRSLLPPPPAAPGLFCACAQPSSKAPLGAIAVLALAGLGVGARRRLLRAAAPMVGVALLAASGCAGDAAGPSLEIGTGESRFEALTEGQDVTMVQGVQGGFHVWMSLRATELDREQVWLDVETEIAGQPYQSEAVTQFADADAAGEHACELVGWPVILADPWAADGQPMPIRVSIVDEEGATADGEVTVTPHLPELMLGG